jgi:hypothetical protein
MDRPGLESRRFGHPFGRAPGRGAKQHPDALNGVTASGEWVNDRTRGQQFRARFLKTTPPTSIDGIEKYLGSGMIRGIGPAYAKKLVRAFGEKVFDMIEAQPDRLREVTGIGPVRAKRTRDGLLSGRSIRIVRPKSTAQGSDGRSRRIVSEKPSRFEFRPELGRNSGVEPSYALLELLRRPRSDDE